MRFTRGTLVFLALAWTLVVLYPDPTVLVGSVRNLLAPRVGSASVAALAARLPDDPREIERLVLGGVVPYASDWEAAGVPWSFPTAAEALAAGRGDCESRAVVLAGILEAKGIPYSLRLSFDHIWVDYPGKIPTESENDARTLAGRGEDGWAGLRWPDDLDLLREVRAQRAIYWDPMPGGRKALLFGGLAWVVSWNVLATAPWDRRRVARVRAALEMRSTPQTGGGAL